MFWHVVQGAADGNTLHFCLELRCWLQLRHSDVPRSAPRDIRFIQAIVAGTRRSLAGGISELVATDLRQPGKQRRPARKVVRLLIALIRVL